MTGSKKCGEPGRITTAPALENGRHFRVASSHRHGVGDVDNTGASILFVLIEHLNCKSRRFEAFMGIVKLPSLLAAGAVKYDIARGRACVRVADLGIKCRLAEAKRYFPNVTSINYRGE